jgi:hypothetical protein
MYFGECAFIFKHLFEIYVDHNQPKTTQQQITLNISIALYVYYPLYLSLYLVIYFLYCRKE